MEYLRTFSLLFLLILFLVLFFLLFPSLSFLFFDDHEVSLDAYIVYGHLKRKGYIVRRTPKPLPPPNTPSTSLQTTSYDASKVLSPSNTPMSSHNTAYVPPNNQGKQKSTEPRPKKSRDTNPHTSTSTSTSITPTSTPTSVPPTSTGTHTNGFGTPTTSITSNSSYSDSKSSHSSVNTNLSNSNTTSNSNTGPRPNNANTSTKPHSNIPNINTLPNNTKINTPTRTLRCRNWFAKEFETIESSTHHAIETFEVSNSYEVPEVSFEDDLYVDDVMPPLLHFPKLHRAGVAHAEILRQLQIFPVFTLGGNGFPSSSSFLFLFSDVLFQILWLAALQQD